MKRERSKRRYELKSLYKKLRRCALNYNEACERREHWEVISDIRDEASKIIFKFRENELVVNEELLIPMLEDICSTGNEIRSLKGKVNTDKSDPSFVRIYNYALDDMRAKERNHRSDGY